MKTNKYIFKWAGIGIAAAMILYLALMPMKLESLSLFGFIIPVVLGIYIKHNISKEIEREFRVFIEDLRDLLQSGISIVQSLEIISNQNYGKLTPQIRKLTAQVKIGIPFPKAMNNIFLKTPSKTITKMVTIINESQKSGGNIIKIFKTAVEYIEKIEELKKKRQVQTMSVITNSYLMFFIFLGIIIGIQVFFIPMMGTESTFDITGSGGEKEVAVQQTDYSTLFLALIIIQSLFAGPMIGKISENNITSGIKHSAILLTLSVSIYVIALSTLVPAPV